MKRISVDIGGTFTDCFVAWDGRYIQAKALTTHHNLALGFNEALDHACGTLGLKRNDVLGEVDSVRYATTLGTNALIERRGPRWGPSSPPGSRPRSRCRAAGATARAWTSWPRTTCPAVPGPTRWCRRP